MVGEFHLIIGGNMKVGCTSAQIALVVASMASMKGVEVVRNRTYDEFMIDIPQWIESPSCMLTNGRGKGDRIRRRQEWRQNRK